MVRDSLTSTTSPQVPQQQRPLPPQSPESLSRAEAFGTPYTNAVTIDTSEVVHPETLHLKPVTWETLPEITFPPGERFEIVDGLLVWLPMGNGTEAHQRIIKALLKYINLLQSWWAASGLDVEVNSTSGKSDAANSRSPDVIITRRRPGSPTDSSGSERTPRKHVLLTKDKPAYAQIEVTSESTRATDLAAKWLQYYHTGITFYYIIDLYGKKASGKDRVIVGSRQSIQHWIRCDNGDPDEDFSSITMNDRTGCDSYYKKVFTGDEQVNIGIFEDQPLTALQLLSSTVLNQRAEQIKQRNESLSQENERLRAEIARSRGSSSKFRLDTGHTKQKQSGSGSSRRQSTGSQSTSPTNSPQKKRYKHKKLFEPCHATSGNQGSAMQDTEVAQVHGPVEGGG